MRSRFPAALALGLLLAATHGAAQRQAALPPPSPVSLSVPHPIQPIPTSPRVDLFTVPQPPPPPDFNPPHDVYGATVFVPTGYGPLLSAPAPPTPVPPPPRGGLRFETSPGSAQVYVDGGYAGIVEDFGIFGHAMDLVVGLHRVDLRAAEYVPAGFDVNITANQTTRFRGDLQRALPPATARTASAPKPTYVIPNCYAGDRPPTRALPRGCSLAQMQIRQP